MSDFRPVNRGDSLESGITARWFNTVTENLGKRRPFGAGKADVFPPTSVRCLVKNDSASNCPVGGVLLLTAPLFTPTDRAHVVYEGLVFSGDTPAAGDPNQHVAIMEKAVDVGDIGFGVIPGAVWAQVNISNAAHTYAEPGATVASLVSNAGEGFPIIWKESGTGVLWAIVRLSVNSDGNLIRATVNQPGGSSAATINFDSAIAYVGTAPPGGDDIFNNIHGETFADNAVVWLAQRKDNGEWEPDRAGGSSGSQLIYFELTQDKSYSDAAKLAKPVDETGTIVAAAAAFYVVDDQRQFYGLASTGGEEGYRGVALLYTDDYSGGVSGYRIITMEGPAHLLTGVLSGSYSLGGTPFTPSTTQIWGRPLRNRRLPATGSITVFDDDDVASIAQSGDKWLIAWNEADEHYVFVLSLETATNRVIHFELIEDKPYTGITRLAKPVGLDGLLDEAADSFYVVDPRGEALTAAGQEGIGQFWGLAAYEDYDSTAHNGYRGFALRYLDDINSTGKPGYRIIDMEGPAQFLPVEVINGGTFESDCKVIEGRIAYGMPDRGRMPRKEGSDFDVVVKDLLKIASAPNPFDGQRWMIAWDENAEEYTFWRLLDDFHVIRFDSPGVTRDMTTFEIGASDYQLVRGVKPLETLTITNLPKCDCPAGEEMFARFNLNRSFDGSDLNECWDTGDGGNFVWFLRGLQDFYPNATEENAQIVENYGALEPHWHDVGACTTP